ncbi:MAG: L-threonylcarbamoyladenylate synthase, partial [Candidatus Omnitrophica bacterium]|nr:L-threonylcarbamoyladenylate synthase [Candidatus Omnitrophota bacterium]
MKRINIDNANVDSLIIDEAVTAILKGGIVAMPTETVYGLAVDPDNESSLKKLYEVKQRPDNFPLSLAFANKEVALGEYFSVLPPFGYRLAEKFWPGPLTIIYFDKAENKIGVRIPSDPVANRIL